MPELPRQTCGVCKRPVDEHTPGQVRECLAKGIERSPVPHDLVELQSFISWMGWSASTVELMDEINAWRSCGGVDAPDDDMKAADEDLAAGRTRSAADVFDWRPHSPDESQGGT